MSAFTTPATVAAQTAKSDAECTAEIDRATPVSVVVPMFNEAEVAPLLVESLLDLQTQLAELYEFEFVLVDDGSRDGTADKLSELIAERPSFRLVRHLANRGIGAAIQTGLREARHETVVSMDCDGSYDPLLVAELVPRLEPGVDLVTASPYHPDGVVDNVPLWRLRLSRLASQLYGLVCRRKLSCYTSCFRVYRRSAVRSLSVSNEGFVGVAELLCRLIERGGRVVEHPARLQSRVAGHSKMRVVRASLGHLRLMSRLLGRRMSGRTEELSPQSN
jgi:glycosyltransferase involved in cell wall biosynthesis